MTLDLFFHIFRQMLFVSIPILIVSIGGLFSERSGVINIALEGIMIFGSFFGIITLHYLEPFLSGQVLFLVAMLVTALSGVVIASIHAFASINMNADQTISGTAINIFAPAVTVFLARLVYSVKEIPFKNQFVIQKIPFLGDIPFIGPMFFQRNYITTYIGVAILLITIYVIYKTKFGLRLRAAGENPHALDAAGVSVKRIRWIAVIMSGGLGALGGFFITVPISTAFTGTVNGYGFLAIAILIFAQWKPLNILFASLFFGFMMTISNVYSVIPALASLPIPGQIYKTIPYVATLLVLLFTSKKSAAPRSLGEPYDQGKR